MRSMDTTSIRDTENDSSPTSVNPTQGTPSQQIPRMARVKQAPSKIGALLIGAFLILVLAWGVAVLIQSPYWATLLAPANPKPAQLVSAPFAEPSPVQGLARPESATGGRAIQEALLQGYAQGLQAGRGAPNSQDNQNTPSELDKLEPWLRSFGTKMAVFMLLIGAVFSFAQKSLRPLILSWSSAIFIYFGPSVVRMLLGG